jgi:hypothetical protein
MLAKFKLAVIRKDEEICSIVPEIIEGKDLFKITASSSLTEFPIANLNSRTEKINKLFMTFSKNDFLSISNKKNENDNFEPFFKGIFLNKHINYSKNTNETELKISAIHSFFKLTLLQFRDIKSYNNILFNDFLTEITNIIDIRPDEISVSDEIKKINIRLISYNTNVFRIFKDICLQNNLSVDFGMNNTINIEYINDKTKRILGQKPVFTITQDDILSMSNTEGII